MGIEPKDSEGCAAQDGTRSSELIGTAAGISPAHGVLFSGLRRATTTTSLPTGAGPRRSELRGQDLRPADQRCDRGGPSKSAVLRLEVIQDLRDQTGLDGLRRRLQGTGYANGMASRGETEATTPSHGMRRHRSWRNSRHAPRIGATARAAVHDCRHNEKCARRWCPFVPYSTRYHFGTLRNRSTPCGPQKCERVPPLRRHSPAHRALAPPARAAPWQDLRRRRWLVNQARLLPGADVAGVSPVPVQMWQG